MRKNAFPSQVVRIYLAPNGTQMVDWKDDPQKATKSVWSSGIRYAATVQETYPDGRVLICLKGYRTYWYMHYEIESRALLDELPIRAYWPPHLRPEGCPECFGTGLTGGFQAPCGRGCKP